MSESLEVTIEEEELEVEIEEGITVLYPWLYSGLVTIDVDPKTIIFDDISGFPATITNAEFWSITILGGKEQKFSQVSISNTQLVLKRGSVGDQLPIDVRILIKGDKE